MKLRCPNCLTLYSVDPEKVRAHDGRARCGRCDEVFPIAQHTEAEASPEVAAPPTPAPESTGAGAPHFFGPQDPNQRARHLARALVSDIVAYYPDRLEQSRAAGTLKDEFREEILKSWEEFVLQVGSDFARETDHFRIALNDILAGGEQVF